MAWKFACHSIFRKGEDPRGDENAAIKQEPKMFSAISGFGEIIASTDHSFRPKIFAPFDFYRSGLIIRLIQKICENVKTITIYLKYI
jgi:hypothetical protein